MKLHETLSLTALLTIFTLTGTIVFLFTSGTITENFFLTFAPIGIAAFLFYAFTYLVDYALTGTEAQRNLFLYEPSRPAWWLGTGFLAALTFASLIAGLALTDTASFQPPNPYTAEPLSQETLSSKSTATNLFLISVIPGVLEEALVLGLILSLISIASILAKTILGINVKNNPGLYSIVALPSIMLGALAFAWGHGRYGGDVQAQIVAFVFEALVQSLNILTGGFWSWLPHMAHNASLTLQQSLALTLTIIPLTPMTMNLSGIKQRIKETWEA